MSLSDSFFIIFVGIILSVVAFSIVFSYVPVGELKSVSGFVSDVDHVAGFGVSETFISVDDVVFKFGGQVGVVSGRFCIIFFHDALYGNHLIFDSVVYSDSDVVESSVVDDVVDSDVVESSVVDDVVDSDVVGRVRFPFLRSFLEWRISRIEYLLDLLRR